MRGRYLVLLLKLIIFTIIGIGIGITIGIIIYYLNKFFFPKPPSEPRGKQFAEAQMNYHNYMLRTLKQRIHREGIRSIEMFEYLLSRYSPLGLTDLYHELKSKVIDPESEDKLKLGRD